MKYRIENWTIARLCQVHTDKKLDLNPPYQRNSIWSVAAQRRLIETILKGQPIPNFFVRVHEDGRLEMVDGQQRARSILAFRCSDLPDSRNQRFKELSAETQQAFDDYQLTITLITDLDASDSIEKYYALVNSTGLRVNRPEIFKAEYHDTRFLRLIQETANNPDFYELRLFTASKRNRMEDIDFASELLSLLQNGITDKKLSVDDMFAYDLSESTCEALSTRFRAVMRHIARFNGIIPVFRTRYRQKNDFYTLFGFIDSQNGRSESSLDYYYKLLVAIDPHISPSQERCDPLKQYAVNCVMQSNTKKARTARNAFLQDLLLNNSGTVNDVQAAVMAYFKMPPGATVNLDGFTTIDAAQIHDLHNLELPI